MQPLHLDSGKIISPEEWFSNPEIDLKIKKISLLSASFLFFLCILHRQKDASKLRWGKKKPTESDI